MRYDVPFSVRYVTDKPVPIREIIESLQGVDALLTEAAGTLPGLLKGIEVEHIEIRVSQIEQASPLRELFVLSLFLTFQDDLEAEVPEHIGRLVGHPIPDNLDTIVTLSALIIAFYTVGIIKDLTVGRLAAGPAKKQLDGLIRELASETNVSEDVIRARLEERYAKRPAWKKAVTAVGRFFRPSKQQDSAPMEVGNHYLDHDTVRDVPRAHEIKAEIDRPPFESFENVLLDLHAQDRDHGGRGWAATIPNVIDKRVRVKLMPGVHAADLWQTETVRGDVTVLFEQVADRREPKEIHLHRFTAATHE